MDLREKPTPVTVELLWDALCTQDSDDEGSPLTGYKLRQFGNPTRAPYYTSHPALPNHGVYYYGDVCLVLSAGLKSLEMGLEFFEGWQRLEPLVRSYGFLPVVWRWANTLFRQGIQPFVNQRTTFVLVGHSGGGPFMEALGFLLTLRGYQQPWTVITGGSPRALLTSHVSNFKGVNRWRMMYPFDPVCYLPPRWEESPSSWGVAATRQTNALNFALGPVVFALDDTHAPALWGSFSHGPGGIVTYPDGHFIGQTAPLVASRAVIDIANWLVNQDARHSKVTQLAAIRAWADRWREQHPGSPHGGGDWGQDEEAGEIVQTTGTAYVTVPTANTRDVPRAESSGEPPLPGPAMILPVPERFVIPMPSSNLSNVNSKPAVGGGRKYDLYLAGHAIASFNSSGRSGTVRRAMVKFLRMLDKADWVDSEEFIMGVNQYLSQAAVGNGFSNTQVTVL